uniref:Uncharacterized protein n=1 Tax=Anguilla anguilla TaxID=7936 RepID=A0A0E9VZ91_ANGAN
MPESLGRQRCLSEVIISSQTNRMLSATQMLIIVGSMSSCSLRGQELIQKA